MNREMVLAIRERDVLYTLTKLHLDNAVIASQYLQKKKFVANGKVRLRAAFETDRFVSAVSDPGKRWKLYKKVLFNSRELESDVTVTVSGQPVDDCDVINDYFCTVGSNLAASLIATSGYELSDISSLYTHLTHNNWDFQPITADAVNKVINELPNKKSTSIDKVPISLLKHAVNKISVVIADCFNNMLTTRVFPNELLKGRLKLIHKSGDNDIDNFRGLTILPSVSKVFEDICASQLINYLEAHNVIGTNQFGFLKNSSCSGAALQMVNAIKPKMKQRYT